jgi:pyrroline-5-carboxylate reductase
MTIELPSLPAVPTIGFIGVGNMGEALLHALLKAGTPPASITFAVRGSERSAEISEHYQVAPATLADMAARSDILLLIVKPQDLNTIMDAIAPTLKSDSLIISFLAGKRIATIEAGLGGDRAVVRIMPNTPTLVGAGISIVSYGSAVSQSHKEFISRFMNACGTYVELEEPLQDAAAATSGSGPAYLFAFTEAMIAGAMEMGISQEIANQLVIQTFVGAAKMLQETGKSPSTLRENVTSPKGMTYEGLKVFSASDLDKVVAKAMAAAAQRSRELA